MYRQAYQRGMLTIFFSVGSKPLAIWDTYTQDGYITRFLDDDIKSMVLEIGGTNVSTTYMICPKGNAVLGITMPFLVMIVKNLKKYFSFEVTILDETGTRRRFRVSNFQSTTQILPLCTVMPIGLTEGWNQIQFNLAEFTRRAYKKEFVEVQKLKINANIRLRRIYFAERIVPEEQLPAEYKLFFPIKQKPVSVKAKKIITEKTEEPIELPQKTTELKSKAEPATLPSKCSKTSMQVIKTDSQAQQLEVRSSPILKVAEHSLDRINAATAVLSNVESILAIEPEQTEDVNKTSAEVTNEAEKTMESTTEKAMEITTEKTMKSTTTVEGVPTTDDEVAGGYEEDKEEEEDEGGPSCEQSEQ